MSKVQIKADSFMIRGPKKIDGTKDMRYGINKLHFEVLSVNGDVRTAISFRENK